MSGVPPRAGPATRVPGSCRREARPRGGGDAAGPPARADQGGFALIAALWLVAAVSFVLAAVALESRPERHFAANAREDVRARAAARAGLARALSRLHRTASDRRAGVAAWTRLLTPEEAGPSPGRLAGRQEGTGRYRVALRDPAARLPLNDIGLVPLRRLFRALGASTWEASVAAQSVLDWRDPDGLHRPNGAEWEDHYRHLQPPVRPRNGPFRSVRELRRVRGIDGGLYRRAARHLTVRSGGGVNVNTAPEPVLEALPGLDRMAAAAILRRRRLGRPLRSLEELARLLPATAAARIRRRFAPLSRRVAFEPRRIVIASAGRVEASGARAVVRALAVRRQGDVRVVWRVER